MANFAYYFLLYEMLAYLFILLFGFSVQDTVKQDTAAISMRDSMLPRTDTLPKKKKKKILPDSLAVIKVTETMLPADTLIEFYKEEKRVLYFGKTGDTAKTVISLSAFLMDTSRTMIYDVQQKRKQPSRYWIFYVMLLPVLIFIYVRLNFYNYLREMTRAFFNLTIAQQLYREQESGLTLSALLLNANFVCVGGMYLYLLAEYFHISLPFSGVLLWGILCLLIAAVYLVKYITLSTVTVFFPVAGELNFYNFNVFLFNKMLGISLILFVLVIAFAKPLLAHIAVIASLAMIGFFFAYRFMRGFIIGRDYLLFQKFHFFLYLCTLEIVPAVILVKLLMDWAKT